MERVKRLILVLEFETLEVGVVGVVAVGELEELRAGLALIRRY